MGCFSGCLMSAASDQKLFCELCSPFNCSFHEFVGEKVVSPSIPPLYWLLLLSLILNNLIVFYKLYFNKYSIILNFVSMCLKFYVNNYNFYQFILIVHISLDTFLFELIIQHIDIALLIYFWSCFIYFSHAFIRRHLLSFIQLWFLKLYLQKFHLLIYNTYCSIMRRNKTFSRKIFSIVGLPLILTSLQCQKQVFSSKIF